MRLADGTVIVPSSQFGSEGFGESFTQDFSWTNGAGYASTNIIGSGMVLDSLPTISQANGGATVYVVAEAGVAYTFDGSTSTSWSQRIQFQQEKLTYTSGTDTYTFTDTTGRQINFIGFNSSQVNARGTFDKLIDQYGNVTQ